MAAAGDQQTAEKKLNTSTLYSSVAQTLFMVLPCVVVAVLSTSFANIESTSSLREKSCYQRCRIRIVESIPDNITFAHGSIPPSTYFAWSRLIERAEKEMFIAAYKSSLQGKHVLPEEDQRFAREGNDIFSALLQVGRSSKVKIHMVENYPPKDKGDNADGIILQNYGAVNRRSVDIEKTLGRGKMHSKFLLSDNKHFYLGSANLDWRSLNQKMELGVLVEDCECLGDDLKQIFRVYWKLDTEQRKEALATKAIFNMENPLSIQIEGEKSEIYIASSPKELNNVGRTWDLDAITSEIDSAKERLDIHVMDYFPMFIYRKPATHFPAIDDALRRAIVRGVKVRILAAALHYPHIGTRFLRSLQSLNQMNENVSVQVKIFKVPADNYENIVMQRERRTHNKFMVTEKAAVIGTSNWSGDYFVGGTTGAAIVIKQFGARRAFIGELQEIFQRDWDSSYAHPLEEYYEQCVISSTADYCESQKDPRLLAKPVVDY